MNREKYLRSVRRRLNMPKQLKDRVIEDFISSIDARMEDGQEEAAILAELGAPKDAARELNRQMEEYTFRKSPWRWACLAMAVLSALSITYRSWLTGQVLLALGVPNHASSIGIIGGADGPTSIFVTTKVPVVSFYVLYGFLLCLGLAGFLILRRLKRK